MTFDRPKYRPVALGVDGSLVITGSVLGGFLTKTAGNLTVVNADGVTVIDAFPVVEGVQYFFDITLMGDGHPANGGTVTLASGASGTVLI